MKFNDEQISFLRDLSHVSTGRPFVDCAKFEVAGLVVTGKSRFGEWVRITDAGRSYLSKTLSRGSRAASTRVPGDTGNSNVSVSQLPSEASASRPPASRPADVQPASGAIPNAVRVVSVDGKATYYPIGMFKALRKHGLAVRTKNKHFKQAPLAASAEDVEFPDYAPA